MAQGLQLLTIDFGRHRLFFESKDALFDFGDLLVAGTLQRNAPTIAVAHGPQQIEVGRGSLGRKPRALRFETDDFLEAGLDQIGQLQVLEKQVQELFLRQRELEIILALALVRSALSAAATFASRVLGDAVAFAELLVARQHTLAVAALGRVMKTRLGDVLGRNLDRLTAVRVGDGAIGDRLPDRFADLPTRPPDEPLPVGKALPLGVLPPIDDEG